MTPTYVVNNGSNNSLNPTVTSSSSESTLIHRVKDSADSEALKTLINTHTGIYVEIINRYSQAYPNTVKREDLIDDRYYNIYRFILDYDPNRGTKLPTYIGDRTDYMCKTLLKKDKNNPLTSGTYGPSGAESFTTLGDTYTTSSGSSVTVMDESLGAQVVNIADRDIKIEDILSVAAFVCKDDRFIQILHFRFFNSPETCLSWREIGKRLGISHEGARLIYNDNLEIVKKHLKDRTS